MKVRRVVEMAETDIASMTRNYYDYYAQKAGPVLSTFTGSDKVAWPAFGSVAEDEKMIERTLPSVYETYKTAAGNLSAHLHAYILRRKEYAHLGNFGLIDDFLSGVLTDVILERWAKLGKLHDDFIQDKLVKELLARHMIQYVANIAGQMKDDISSDKGW